MEMRVEKSNEGHERGINSLHLLSFHIIFLIFPLFSSLLDYPEATYPEFVSFVQGYLEKYNEENKDPAATFSLRGGHLFDRLVTFYVLSGRNTVNRGGKESKESKEGNNEIPSPVPDGQRAASATSISVPYMLVALNMAVKSAAEERTDALFTLAQFLSAFDATEKHKESTVDRTTAEQEHQQEAVAKSIAVKEGETESEREEEGEREEVFINVRAAEEIVRDLYNSWQVHYPTFALILF